MIKIRQIIAGEEKLIADLERKLDLEVPWLESSETWVIEEEKGAIGLARLTDLGQAYFLSSVGLLPEWRGRGLAKLLLQVVLANRKKDIYLYTIIPEFFFRFGFEVVDPPPFVPPRHLFSCHLCKPEKCFCLVKKVSV